MAAAVEPYDISLEAMTQAWLHDSAAGLEVVDQVVERFEVIGFEARHTGRHEPAEQHTAPARRRITGEHAQTQRDPTRGRDRSRVTDLELGQQHRKNLR